MIRTRFNTLGFRIIVAGTCFMIALNLYSIISFLFSVHILNENATTAKIFFIVSFFGIIMMAFIIYKIQIVYLDTINEMIIVKRFITKETTTGYRFNEVDGFYDVAITHASRRTFVTKAIAIIKNKKIVVLTRWRSY